MKTNNLPRASNLIYFRPDGKILAIKRNNKPIGFGLIGGKSNKDESDTDCLCREVKEECGLNIIASYKVFEDISQTGKFWVSTYIAFLDGEIKSSDEGEIVWVSMQDLIDGPFGEYNLKLFRAMGCEI